jgi:hypothetical protein
LYDILCLYGFGVLTMFLLTAVLYNDAMNMNEYMKVVFGLFFVAVFGLYSRNYAILLSAEATIGAVLFWNGYPQYESQETE